MSYKGNFYESDYEAGVREKLAGIGFVVKEV